MAWNPETLNAQRAAREMVKREAKILTPIAALGFIALFGLNLYFARQLSIYITLLLFASYYVAYRAITNWRQWLILQKFQLACPACGRLLAEKIHYFKSPNSKCPHCGEVALAPLKLLNH
jgi:hypothetical protein